MRLRLPGRSPVDYQVLRDYAFVADHRLRIGLTAAMVAWMAPRSVLDPACGDGSIVASANAIRPIESALLADVSRDNFYAVGTGPVRGKLPVDTRVKCQSIEETLRTTDTFDLVVLTEILEHLDDPVSILRLARERASVLVASSPMFPNDLILDPNPEHLWQFDIYGFGQMLLEGGWDTTVAMVPVNLADSHYDYQLWIVR